MSRLLQGKIALRKQSIGYGPGTFLPNVKLLRGEAFSIVIRELEVLIWVSRSSVLNVTLPHNNQ